MSSERFWAGYALCGVIFAAIAHANGGNFLSMVLGAAAGGMFWVGVVAYAARRNDKKRREQ